jgi:hypothetical protein
MGELEKKLPSHIRKIYYPIDFRGAVSRAMRTLHPDAIMLVEAEIWPNFIWRANKTWRAARMEVPWLTRPPSDYIREHVRLTVQPFDAPPSVRMTEQIIEEIGSDEILLFSTDFPHWHFDGEDSLPDGMSTSLARKIAIDNPLKTYPRLTPEDPKK